MIGWFDDHWELKTLFKGGGCCGTFQWLLHRHHHLFHFPGSPILRTRMCAGTFEKPADIERRWIA